MPEVIVIDEIGTELEAAAARTIAERGVQLVGTAHGNTLENLMMNPPCPTSSAASSRSPWATKRRDAAARRSPSSNARRRRPSMSSSRSRLRSSGRPPERRRDGRRYPSRLRGAGRSARARRRGPDAPSVRCRSPWPGRRPRDVGSAAARRGPASLTRRIYPFGISRKRLEQAIHQTATSATVSDYLSDADVVMTLRNFYRRKPQALREAEARGLPVYVLRSNTISQMEQSLLSFRGDQGRFDPVAAALQEAETAISQLMEGDDEIELSPQNSYIRRLQHQLAQQYSLSRAARGREPTGESTSSGRTAVRPQRREVRAATMGTPPGNASSSLFEGGEGAGKTTQAQLLGQRLGASGSQGPSDPRAGRY